jgi:lipopolysaccharide transport system permease protein
MGKRLVYLRDLITVLVARDMKLRYKRSILGFAWSLLNPLAQMLVFGFVFRFVLPLNIPHYSPFLITGLLAWNWFNAASYQATEAIVGNRELVRRPGFPAAILPVVAVSSHLVHFVLALPVLALFLVLNSIPLTPALLALPLVIAVQFIFTLSLAYLVATFHVTFRDTQYLLGIFLLLGFYLTPVFYNPGSIPQKYQVFYRLNPMLHLIESYRLILLEGQLPSALTLAGLGAVSLLLLLAGYRVFRTASDRFVEEL